MDPTRWLKIEEIFNEAVDLAGDERRNVLASRCAGDDELLVEVEKLLSQYEEASSFIEQPIIDSRGDRLLSALLDDGIDDPMIGKVLGSYRVEQEIGRGGMGAVYEATRADGEFRLRVALKVVKRGVDTDFVLKRFRNERQILAALDHPLITRLIDGGTTDDGRPYFVMEFVDGLPLYRFADKNRLTLRQRLELFCQVCSAVEYAHGRRVIHRDLKPSNIIVTGDGTPRLLDFGIAKLLDPEMAIDTLQPTATALRMMTVDYASPEQVRGEKVTFSTDVYSLGVILFELLTGRRPYRLKSRSPHDVARAICDDDPYLPSEAVVRTDEDIVPVKVSPVATTLPGTVMFDNGSPEKLSDLLKGVLDNVILRAMRKEPEARYSNVGKFREDIERYLKGEAVEIEPQFPRARRVSSGVSKDSKFLAVLPLSLMGPTTAENTDESYLTVGLADAIITRLTSVRKLTVRPTSSITRYNEHLINPIRAGVELGVDFVLDGRIRRFGERLRISLQLLDVNAGSAIWAGQFDENLTDVLELEDAISEQVAAALIPQLTGEEKEKLAKRGTNDPQAYEAYLRGRFYWNQFTSQSLPKALESFEAAIRIDPGYALAYVGIADFYIWANIYGLIPVRDSYEHANAAARKALELDPELGDAYASFGLIRLNQFEYEKAESLFRRSIELNPHYSLAHEWYSAYLIGNGRFEEGLAEIRRAEELDPLSLRTKVLVAWSYYQAGEFSAALAKTGEIIALDSNYAQGHLQRGYVLCELGRPDEAVVSLERAMELMPGSSLAQYHYCFALTAAGRIEEAKETADEMKERSRTEYIKPMFLGYAAVAVGRIDEAFEYFEISVDERDPWMTWFATEVKLGPIRDDKRYLDILERTRKSISSGKLRALVDTDPNGDSSLGYENRPTSIESEMQTLSFPKSFVRRNYGKLAAAAVVLVSLIAAYWSGILTVSFRDGRFIPLNSSPTVRSVAVLPFENATGDPSNDYISDGLSENLIGRMSSLTDIRTISRSAAFSYRTKQMDPQSIGRELGVDAVLVGSLSSKGDEFTVNTDLIRVDDAKKLFSMFFVEKAGRIVALQDAMANRIIDTLGTQNRPKATTASKGYTENNDAFQSYLKGEFHRQKATPADINASIEFYQNALMHDPNYALAYQGLSLAYRSAPAYGAMFPQEAYPKAKDAAQKALAIDPTLSTAYVSLASIKATYDWDYAGAEQEYKHAIEMGPNNAEAHYSYGNFLVAMGKSEAALSEYRIAQQIDPLSLSVPTNVGWAMYISGRNDEAIAEIRKVIERDPSFARGYMSLGEILEEQGKYDESIAAVQRARELSLDPLADMALGHIYASAGRKAEAQKIAVELEERVRRKEVSPFLPAVVYAGLNEKDKAFYWLERAYQERSNWLTLIKVGRRLKNLHGDPRFDDLLTRVGFQTQKL